MSGPEDNSLPPGAPLDDQLKRFLEQSDRRDQQLTKFLDEAARDRAKGLTLANVLVELKSISARQKEDRSEIGHLRVRVDRHGREIKALKGIAKYDGELDTGQHDVAEIQREVELQLMRKRVAEHEKNDGEIVWWKRSIVQWIVGAIAFCIVQAITVLIALAITKHTVNDVPKSAADRARATSYALIN